jgi:hypothetical protein
MRRLLVLPILVIPLAVLAIASACRPADAPPASGRVAPDEATVAARGAEVLAPFKRELMAALTAGLAEGPEEAIAVCRVRAPALAEEAGSASVRVGRTSHRVRNPANAPEPWMRPLLDAYLAEPRQAGPRVVALDGDRVGYTEPIFAQPMCLACHGDALAPGVSARLAELYPEDTAVGFSAGDLRGLFWVVFDDAGEDEATEGGGGP